MDSGDVDNSSTNNSDGLKMILLHGGLALLGLIIGAVAACKYPIH